MGRLKTLKPALKTLGFALAPQTAEREAWRTQTAAQQTTTERGYGWEWQQLRERILKRDGYLCQTCQRAGRLTVATEVDHIRSKAQGGSDDPSNLEAIDTDCHRAKTQREAAQARGG